MASLPPVKVPAGKWVDVYLQTSIPVGTQLIVQNTGDAKCILVDSPVEPNLSTTGKNNINTDEFLTSATTPDGSWAYSDLGTELQVEEA